MTCTGLILFASDSIHLLRSHMNRTRLLPPLSPQIPCGEERKTEFSTGRVVTARL